MNHTSSNADESLNDEFEDQNYCGALLGQVVLVMQGGGALGAFQAGVYEALNQAAMEPDWVIGTSIGAINAALIAANPIDRRVTQLRNFWNLVANDYPTKWLNNWGVLCFGVNGFFYPQWPFIRQAAFYSNKPLIQTLHHLCDVSSINPNNTRLSVGSVEIAKGVMKYFDSHQQTLGIEHIMASAALPLAFPAVHINGESFWDGGIYSNTPIELVLNEYPRKSSLIWCVNIWQQQGDVPKTLADSFNRQKDIQFSSHSQHHLQEQQKIHYLRHVIRALANKLPRSLRQDPYVSALAKWGCSTTMHIMDLQAPHMEEDDVNKDIDFRKTSILKHWQSGFDQANQFLTAQPWLKNTHPLDGVIVHHLNNNPHQTSSHVLNI